MGQCMAVRVIPVPGTKETPRSGLAYLIHPDDPAVTVDASIAELWKTQNEEMRKLWSRFDFWSNGGIRKEYFHGWDEKGFEHCFVFKWNAKRDMQRMYGSLFHPKKQMNPRFQLCLLFSHCVKVGRYTDPEQKKKAELLQLDKAVLAAITSAYPDKAR